MPAVAAHALFGQAVFSKLPSEIQTYLTPHHNDWMLGLQGPDVLFYHQPLRKNPISTFGHDLHAKSPAAFFLNAPWDDPRQVAYLLGFACHYGLDRGCHPMINQASAQQVTKHSSIESQFDLYKLEQHALPRQRAMWIPKLKSYTPIAMAYGLPESIVSKSGRSFRRYTSVLDHPKVVHMANKDHFSALCLPETVEQVALCEALEQCFLQAVPTTAQLVERLYHWGVYHGYFPTDLAWNFEGEPCSFPSE